MNKSLQEIQEYYTKNSDRIKKRLNSEGVYEEDPWIFRTLSRYKDHLNVYVQDELESLGYGMRNKLKIVISIPMRLMRT